MIRQLILVVAVLMYWPYAAVLAYGEFAADCTRGGEGLLPSLFVGGPIVFVATVVVWLSRARLQLNSVLRLSVVASLSVAAAICLWQIWNVTIQGHHPCGADYDAFRAFVEKWDDWVPVINLGLVAIAAFISLGPYARYLPD